MSDMKDIGEKIDRLLELDADDFTSDEKKVLRFMAQAMQDRKVGELGVDALADFIVVLRGVYALRGVARILFWVLVGLGTISLNWDRVRTTWTGG